MWSKKILLSMLNLKDLKEGNVSFIDIIMKVDKKNLEKLLEAGYDPMKIVASLSYKYPAKYPGDTLLYLYIFAQDLIKGRFFNESRPLALAMLKQSVYNIPLSDKEKQNYGFDSEEEVITTSVEKQTNPHTFKKIIAFSSTAPSIGKTTLVNTLIDQLTEEGYSVDSLTIAERIRSCLVLLANVIDKDSSRFFENYFEKDISKTYGNETIPFKTRDLLCEFSLLVQKYYGIDVWGKAAANTLLESDANIIFIDDLRREDEFQVLKETFKQDLIVISLDKEDVDNNFVKSQLSDAAKAFEAKLNSDHFDYSFTFNSDWSNTPELIKLVKSLIS